MVFNEQPALFSDLNLCTLSESCMASIGLSCVRYLITICMDDADKLTNELKY